MPISKESLVTAGVLYASPFEELAAPQTLTIDPTNFTADEIDDYGYIKPGLPLGADGQLITVAATPVFGCVAEATKVCADNAAATLAAADPIAIVVYRQGAIRKTVLAEILGRVLTATEIAAFDVAGSQFSLLA